MLFNTHLFIVSITKQLFLYSFGVHSILRCFVCARFIVIFDNLCVYLKPMLTMLAPEWCSSFAFFIQYAMKQIQFVYLSRLISQIHRRYPFLLRPTKRKEKENRQQPNSCKIIYLSKSIVWNNFISICVLRSIHAYTKIQFYQYTCANTFWLYIELS